MNAVCRKKSAGKHVRFNLIIYTATICAEGEKSMFIKIALYALFSSMGLVFLKLGTKQGLYVVFERQAFSFHMNYIAVLGMCFYIAGFLLSLSIMKETDLNFFYSVSVGFVYICVCLLSYVLLQEAISVSKIVGMCLILSGIIIINISR